MVARLCITVNDYYLVVPFEWESLRIRGRAEEVKEKKEVRAEKSGMRRALRRIVRNGTGVFRTIQAEVGGADERNRRFPSYGWGGRT